MNFCNIKSNCVTNQQKLLLNRMKYPIKKYFPLLFGMIALVTSAQNTTAISTQFDQTIGRNNLGYNNGTIHINSLRSANDTHRYFNTDKYIIGTLVYDGQVYTDIPLKYDLLKDIAVAKIDGENNALGINLITHKTNYFQFGGKKFVNLNYQNAARPKFIEGFYEEDLLSDQFAFYTKHAKESSEVLRTNGVFYQYELSRKFVFQYQNVFYRLNSKGDVVSVFPQFEKEIDVFFERNTALANENLQLFYLTLLKQINDSLPKPTR